MNSKSNRKASVIHHRQNPTALHMFTHVYEMYHGSIQKEAELPSLIKVRENIRIQYFIRAVSQITGERKNYLTNDVEEKCSS